MRSFMERTTHVMKCMQFVVALYCNFLLRMLYYVHEHVQAIPLYKSEYGLSQEPEQIYQRKLFFRCQNSQCNRLLQQAVVLPGVLEGGKRIKNVKASNILFLDFQRYKRYLLILRDTALKNKVRRLFYGKHRNPNSIYES